MSLAQLRVLRPSRSVGAKVVLIGFEDLDNLGLRYLASALRAKGHEVRVVPVSSGIDAALDAIKKLEPHVVGFSLIFQFYVDRFRSLTDGMRRAGVKAHFTCGGHFPSFEPERTLKLLPALDSVCRFESEDTLVSLAAALAEGGDFRLTPGVSFRAGDKTEHVPSGAPVTDLDSLPWPDRDDIDFASQHLPTASLLGSRGCPWRCSFCSIVTFYAENGTKGRRRRDPALIADELEHLHRDRGVVIALWQDDDFLAGGKKAIEWAHQLAAECIRRGLHQGMRWKISARSDEIREGVLEPLVEAGLAHVYLGVESGDPVSLQHLNKHMGPEAHFTAAEILRRLGLSFDFGFQLLEPWSTVDTVRGNLEFLRAYAGDGWTPAGFCRTLPYAGTPLEKRLRDEKRLIEDDNLHVDYRFLDPRLDTFYDWSLAAFRGRNEVPGGTWNLLKVLSFEAALDLPFRPRDDDFRARLRGLTALANQLLVDTTEAALDHVIENPAATITDPGLTALAAMQARQEQRLRSDLALLLRERPPLMRVHVTA